ncbi:MAG: type IV secretory system conjugative DNA transfer family protein [Rhodoglobus sp.]
MNASRNWWVTPILGVLAAIIIANVACQGIAAALTTLECGSAATPRHFFAGVYYAITGNTEAYTTAAGCQFPAVPVRVLDIVVLLLVLVGSIIAWLAWLKYRQSDEFFIREMRTRIGFAQWAEVVGVFSSRAVLKRSKIVRPNLKNPKATDVGWKVGRSRGIDVFISIEDSVVLEVASRSPMGERILKSAICDWSGPLITTSTTHYSLAATMSSRAQRGTVTIFDPEGISGMSSGLRISPIVGCEDPLVAGGRAQAIVSGAAGGPSKSDQNRSGIVASMLARLMHAAALSGGSVEELYRWGSIPSQARAAVDILRQEGAPGWAEDLESVISGDPKVLAENWLGVTGAVRPLSFPPIRAALSPARHEIFDTTQFLSGENTLYVVGSGFTGGFLCAAVSDIVDTARGTAMASPGSRLDKPLGLILDEIANMFSWGGLSRVMAEAGPQGISALVMLHSFSQAETLWSKAEVDTVWSTAAAKVVLGGASNVARLRDIEAILGTRRIRKLMSTYSRAGEATTQQYEQVPVMKVDEIRRMPDTMGLLAYHNRRGVLLDLRNWAVRSESKAAADDQKTEEAEQQRRLTEQLQRTAAALQGSGAAGDPMPADGDGSRTSAVGGGARQVWDRR